MRVYFLRHGIAAEAGEWRGPDAGRPLTEEGRELMAREAKTMADLGLGIELVVSSPLLRAVETATIVAAALGLKDGLLEDERLGPGFDAAALVGILAEHEGRGAILLVGHEPTFSRTIGALIGGGRVECRKGSLACVRVVDPRLPAGELAWLLSPKFLARD